MASSFTKYLYGFLTSLFLLIAIIELIAYSQLRIAFILFNLSLTFLIMLLNFETSFKKRKLYSEFNKTSKSSKEEIILKKEKKQIIFIIIEVILFILIGIMLLMLFI